MRKCTGLVKNFNPRQDHFEVMVGMAGKMGTNNNNKSVSSWSLLEVKFIVRGFEVAQETLPLKESPSKTCCHVNNHVIFSFMLEYFINEFLAVS